MQPDQDLFDRSALLQRRARTAWSNSSAWFLHEIAAVQVSERLKEINRIFTDPVIVGWKHEIWANKLGFPARFIEDAVELDLTENSTDLIISGLCLHWSDDPVGQLIQMRRALRPDGLMIAIMFAGRTLHELRSAFARGEARTEGGISPRVAPMADLRALGSLLQRAGFALPVADVFLAQTTYRSPLHLMRDLRAMGETNVLQDRRKTPMRRETMAAVLEAYQEVYSSTDNRINATFELAFLTGWCPSDNQQKPLRPGSAATRLEDALNRVIVDSDEG